MIALVVRFPAQHHLLAASAFRDNLFLLSPPLVPREACAGFGVWRVHSALILRQN